MTRKEKGPPPYLNNTFRLEIVPVLSKSLKVLRRTLYFTLLEMLVVMFIISLGVIVTGVKVQQSYLEQRFYSETQQLVGQLSMAQDLMLILDTDVQVILKTDPDNHQVMLALNVEKPLPDSWARLVEREMRFASLHSFEFETDERNPQDNPLILHFSFGQMSKGKLILSEGKNVDLHNLSIRNYTIDLPGYPSSLGKAQDKERIGRVKDESDQLYPAEVYEELYKNKDKEIKTPDAAAIKKY